MEIKNKLIDPFGREINYLRVSVTDRCDFRCTYCMSEDMQFLPKKDVLSLEEIEEICKSFMKLGTRKIRLTGGEPLVRKGIMQVINNLGKEVGKGLDELTITTNGSQLETKAEELFKAGVRRINVSLDHLDPIKFKEITRWGDLDKVKAGLKIAKEIGLKIKINTVAISEFNEYHLADILNWCGEENFDMTIIEVMPMGDISAKFIAFGWDVLIVEDGNNLSQIIATLKKAKSMTGKGKPICILLKTEMGNGVDFMMNTHAWHGKAPNDEQLEIALAQNPETLGDY